MTATYIYAVTAEPTGAGLEELRGIGDQPVRFLDADGMSCVVSTVDLDEFGEEGLRRNLEDLTWLERTARQHDNVVRACAPLMPTVPLRLATVCTDDESARRRVNEFGDTAREALVKIAGHDEWGVKVFAESAASSSAPDETATVSGASYLQQRRQQLQVREDFAGRVLRVAEDIYAGLSVLAADARRHRAHDRRLTGDDRPMVLNAAFLVDRYQQQTFRSAVDMLTADASDVSAVVTGPWPAYSFAPEPAS